MKTRIGRYWSPLLVFALLLAAFAPCFLSEGLTSRWTEEDGLYESISALGFLVTAVLFLASALRARRIASPARHAAFCWLLAGVFLLGFLEEISWGQRILRLDTPNVLAQHNRQKEINIHNLSWLHGRDHSGKERSFWRRMLNVDRMFSLFWFGLCIALPVAGRMSKPVQAWLARFGVPLVPLWLGFFFVLNYIISKLVSAAIEWDEGQVVEIKETNFAMLFLVVAIVHVLSQDTTGSPVIRRTVLSASGGASPTQPSEHPARRVSGA